ncbi:rRNA methyltransferase 1, mitochondrial [Rhinatrema bivittatum]|uniref:rRNA methyltransferase 1, mitochondrial n=1 Tax=Rhinatrema bivittatum TaxID=194408 RepID=UPI00112692B8|nr:rRNA methyltransferase 1, mitochondrial [Rhinatrema bivittatum]XP_029469024.1 rRNA methyltransferase 1, mitochondrial [Rhinatrema bivittatum]XP_029469025.1 rRNA methyltransferase 1, mitochondrial [Rhinatrema bivittatum]XP_029469026.1 rRNA methyltransferase 1, mitochondrial [Rhinatrema bivittatum]
MMICTVKTIWNWPYFIWKTTRSFLAFNDKCSFHSVSFHFKENCLSQSRSLDDKWIKKDARATDSTQFQTSEDGQNLKREHSPTNAKTSQSYHSKKNSNAPGLYLKNNAQRLMKDVRKDQGPPPRANISEFRYLRDDDFVKRRNNSCKEGMGSDKKSKNSEILFGIAPCYMALMQSRRTFLKLFLKSTRSRQRPEVEAACQRAEACNIPVQLVSKQMLDSLCEGRVHQGMCLEASPLHYVSFDVTPDSEAVNETRPNQQCLWLVLDGLYDPMNMGAVLRSAHFLGVDKVITSQKNSCPLTPVVSKASAGVMEVLEVYSTSSLQEFLKAKINQDWQVIGTTGKSYTRDDEVPVISCSEFLWEEPTLLVLGNEGRGLSPEIRSLCRSLLTVPSGREMQMGMESLNVSVAAGILLHQICSQRVKQ